MFSKLNSDLQDHYSLLIPETLIPNGSDLNDYTTPGHYYTPNAAASQTIQNTPYTGSGFKLIVEKLSSNSHVLQTLKAVNSKFVYYRAASDSDFRDWLTPVTNADLQAGLISFNNMSNGQVYSKEVTFPKTFSSTPYVVVSPVSSVAGTMFATVGARSASKVTINGQRNDSNGVLDVLWIAVAM